MKAISILLLLVGVWVLVNAVNGNLPGLVNGTVSFNTPGTTPSPVGPNQVLNSNGTTSQQATGTTNNPMLPVVNNQGATILRPGAPS